ncbi:MAG: hypothetical protein AAGF75_03205 [Cyanobacteria bacterium P01_H01_bin.130]
MIAKVAAPQLNLSVMGIELPLQAISANDFKPASLFKPYSVNLKTT